MIVITYKDCFEAKISPKFLDLGMIFQPVRAGTGITGKKTIIKQTFWSFWKGNLQLDSLPQL